MPSSYSGIQLKSEEQRTRLPPSRKKIDEEVDREGRGPGWLRLPTANGKAYPSNDTSISAAAALARSAAEAKTKQREEKNRQTAHSCLTLLQKSQADLSSARGVEGNCVPGKRHGEITTQKDELNSVREKKQEL